MRERVRRTPTNALTRQPYQGKNIARLLEAAHAHGWRDLRFLTYMQAQTIGAQVRKGEHGVRLMKVVEHQADDRKPDDRSYKGGRGFTVFHLSQIDNLPNPIPQAQQ